MAEGLTGLCVAQTSKSLGFTFQLSNGAEVKETCMVLRTNQDHTGKVLALGKCSVEENFGNLFVCYLKNKGRQEAKRWRLLLSAKMSNRNPVDPPI